MNDLVDFVLLAQLIKRRVHAVEHRHDCHGGDLAADAGEADHVTEQYRDVLKYLATGT